MLSQPRATDHKRSLERLTRRGSLPLKKRRFRLEGSAAVPHSLPSTDLVPILQHHHQPSDLSFRIPTPGDRKHKTNTLSHLSIIAAAAASQSLLRKSHNNNNDGSLFASSPTSASDTTTKWIPITPPDDAENSQRRTGTPKPQPRSRNKTTGYSSHPSSPKPNKARSPLPATTTTTSPIQDKRYSGSDATECRCRATTTRGRACAYVAVNETPYCYLHAEYATNPPPPRGRSKEQQQQQQQQVIPPVSPKARRRTSAKLAEKHAAATAPLLSMISTDQWYHQPVRMALGPLAGRTGRVEKWGNGWVSVRVDDVVGSSSSSAQHQWHNRRSFELLLLQMPDGAPLTPNSTTTTPKATPPLLTTPKQHNKITMSPRPASAQMITPLAGPPESRSVPEPHVDLRLPKDTTRGHKVPSLRPKALPAYVREDE